jgi:hypothetical protein
MNDPNRLASNEARELFLYDVTLTAIDQVNRVLVEILVGIRPDRGVLGETNMPL